MIGITGSVNYFTNCTFTKHHLLLIFFGMFRQTTSAEFTTHFHSIFDKIFIFTQKVAFNLIL